MLMEKIIYTYRFQNRYYISHYASDYFIIDIYADAADGGRNIIVRNISMKKYMQMRDIYVDITDNSISIYTDFFRIILQRKE